MAYSKQTWDTSSYVNPTRMNHIEQGIYDVDQKINNVIYENIIDNPIVVAYGTTETGNLTSGKYLSGYNMLIGILYDNEYIRGSFVVSRNSTNFNFSNIFSVWYGGNVANGAFKHTSDTSFTITNNSSVSLNFMLRGIKLN